MKNRGKILISAVAFSLCLPLAHAQKNVMSLQECIDYAMEHNVTLLKARSTSKLQDVTVEERKAAWLPSLNASISQGLDWHPFADDNKVTQNGTYGVNANWTAWDGNQRKMNILNAEIDAKRSRLNAKSLENSFIEQIMQRYVQILYMKEALKVNQQQLEHDSIVLSRAETFKKVGQMSEADVAQFRSQMATGKYEVVNAQTNIDLNIMELKQLLDYPTAAAFDVISVDRTDREAMRAIPAKNAVYQQALAHRPEIEDANVAIEQSRLSTKLAKAARLPNIGLSGGLNDSHNTGAVNNWGKQMKSNFNANLGVTVSYPIFDNRKVKSAIERAKINETIAELDYDDTCSELYKTIDKYWQNAYNCQQKYIASKAAVEYQETCNTLLNEQFRLGLKNISELLKSRDNLLDARQTMLQDKYTAILYRELLEFYAKGKKH